jgi:hypothetical protein
VHYILPDRTMKAVTFENDRRYIRAADYKSMMERGELPPGSTMFDTPGEGDDEPPASELPPEGLPN